MTNDLASSDLLDAQADLAADLDFAARLAHADEAADPIERTTALVMSALWACRSGASLASVALDAAEAAVGAQRLVYGCEDWRACDWSVPEVGLLAELHDALVTARSERAPVRKAG